MYFVIENIPVSILLLVSAAFGLPSFPGQPRLLLCLERPGFARSNGLPFEGGMEPDELEGDVTQTTLDALKLKKDEAFGYWFDFGDDWWHQINVLSIEKKTVKGGYPKVIKRIG